MQLLGLSDAFEEKVLEKKSIPGASLFSWIIRLSLLSIVGIVAYLGPSWLSLRLMNKGWSFWWIYFPVLVYGSIPLCYFFYFSHWCSTELINRAAKEVTPEDISVISEIRSQSNSDKTISYIVRRWQGIQERIHNPKDKLSRLVIEIIQGDRLLSLFLFAVFSPGGQSIASFFMGATGVHMKVFLLFFLGNSIKILYSTKLLEIFYGIFGDAVKWVVYGFVFALLAWIFVKPAIKVFFKKSPSQGI